jgi:hypothetical protein
VGCVELEFGCVRYEADEGCHDLFSDIIAGLGIS